MFVVRVLGREVLAVGCPTPPPATERLGSQDLSTDLVIDAREDSGHAARVGF